MIKVRCYFEKNLNVLINSLEKEDYNTLILISFCSNINCDLKKELKKESSIFQRLSAISKKRNLFIFIALVTNLHFKKYLSVGVIDCGEILGMSDMTHKLSHKYSLGNSFKIYNIKDNNFGIVVGCDIFFPEVIRCLVFNEGEFLMHFYDDDILTILKDTIKTHCRLNGTGILSICNNGIILCDEKGLLLYNNIDNLDNNIIELNLNIKIDNTFLRAIREDIYKNVFYEYKEKE